MSWQNWPGIKRAKLLLSSLTLSNLKNRAKLLCCRRWHCVAGADGAVADIAGVTISGTPDPRHIIVPFGAEAPSSHVTQAWAILPPSWGLLSQWHRQQRQRRTERPPPEPSVIHKRFYAFYDIKWRYFINKVSKLYYMFSFISPNNYHYRNWHNVILCIVRICVFFWAFNERNPPRDWNWHSTLQLFQFAVDSIPWSSKHTPYTGIWWTGLNCRSFPN